MFLIFERLLHLDQAEVEHQTWVRCTPELPVAFRQFAGLNLKDRAQCIGQVFPLFRHTKAVIAFFLSYIVFPKEKKSFPQKLSGSGWDLGRVKTFPTTGFSATSDPREVLPLSMHHLDLPAHRQTNAAVLDPVVHPKDSVMILPSQQNSEQSDADLILSTVAQMDPPVQVILDVGAQIIDFNNKDAAQVWLCMYSDHEQTQAVVFVNEEDELCAVDRDRHVEILHVSSFAHQLDVCLIYLDEAHTRGNDLKLPPFYRAAVKLHREQI